MNNKRGDEVLEMQLRPYYFPIKIPSAQCSREIGIILRYALPDVELLTNL